MLILALDTTTAAGSVAIADGGRIVETTPLAPGQPVAMQLPGALIALLERRAVQLAQLDLFAVATGPGSFTGLRIGIATMQGLALPRNKALVGISSFDALASFVDAPRVGVWIDAWRGEVYAAVYERKPVPEIVGEPVVGSPDALLAEDEQRVAQTTFIGDGAVRYRSKLPRVVEPTPLLAGAIAALAHERARAGERPLPHAIRPLYVRRPDAELARDRR